MSSSFLCKIQLNGGVITFKMYDNILDNIESIMKLNYSDNFNLLIKLQGYTSCNWASSGSMIDVSLINKGNHAEDTGLILKYCDGILYSIEYKGLSSNDIKDNLSITDLDDNYDLIGDRLNIMTMMSARTEYGKNNYEMDYKDVKETLLIKEEKNFDEYRYILVDEEVIIADEYILGGSLLLSKHNNEKAFTCSIDGHEVTIELIEFIKCLGELLGD